MSVIVAGENGDDVGGDGVVDVDEEDDDEDLDEDDEDDDEEEEGEVGLEYLEKPGSELEVNKI